MQCPNNWIHTEMLQKKKETKLQSSLYTITINDIIYSQIKLKTTAINHHKLMYLKSLNKM